MKLNYKVCFLDFEFNRIVEPKVNLVCCTTFTAFEPVPVVKDWWLHNDGSNQHSLKKYLEQFDLIIGYSVIAECRSFMALGLDPLKFFWIDEYYEYKCLTNHNDKLQWGNQLVEGKVKYVKKKKPKWEQTEEDEAGGPGGFKATHSLAECTYKLTGQIRDTDHKNKMRALIISDPTSFTEQEKEDIQAYCHEDVLFLPKIFERIIEEYYLLDECLTDELLTEYMLTKGRYAAHTSLMEARGYPIDLKKTKNFSKQVGNILFETQREINSLFPDKPPFRWNKKEGRFSLHQNVVTDWIEETQPSERWRKTPTGKYQLSLDAFQDFFSFAHDYPKDNYGAQFVRYLKLKQSLNGFNSKPGGKKKNFWDSVGSDGRVRPYLNIYGAQSSRSQPGSTAFMFLKPAWMRALVVPAKGKFMAGIDYGSQEFFISALLAEDLNMIDAYLTGDPYLAFAKLSGAVPEHGTKATHKFERDAAKATVLGISYLMTKYGLSRKLTADTGVDWDEDAAQEQIDLFDEVFWKLHDYREQLIEEYDLYQLMMLDCGWYMWGDNPNFRSVANMKIQGMGATIMRKAVEIATAKGVNVSYTLHDAIYMEDDIGNEHKICYLRDAMREAFVFYMPEKFKAEAKKIKLDPFAWSPDYEKDSEMVVGKTKWKIPVSNLYIDDRSIGDFLKFSKYFEDRVEDEL